MKIELLEILRCPKSGQRLRLESGNSDYQEIEKGELISEDGRERYPVLKGIPRFVPQSNYADNFGMQWNYFRQTQLDSYSGHPVSTERFWQATGWKPEKLTDQWVLDAGCGAGRFAEVALLAGAKVVALDYSSAVDACYANLKHHPNLHVVQGDIYALPFQPETFPFVYSLGVLQHTPDVAKAFAALPLMVQGGAVCAPIFTGDGSGRCFTQNICSVPSPSVWISPSCSSFCDAGCRLCSRPARLWDACHWSGAP